MKTATGGALGIAGAVFLGCLALLGVVLLIFGALWGFQGFLGVMLSPGDGQRTAERRVPAVAEALDGKIGRIIESMDAETIAAERMLELDGEETVIPLAWSGTTGNDGIAIVDVRIRVELAEQYDGSFGGRGRTAGAAGACFRYTMRMYEETSHEEISCDDLPSSAATPVSHRPHLPEDAEAQLSAIMTATTATALRDDVTAAFPGDDYLVDTAALPDGELVVALGTPDHHKCLVLVRRADQTVERIGFRPIWAQPGELGCTTGLYTNPPE